MSANDEIIMACLNYSNIYCLLDTYSRSELLKPDLSNFKNLEHHRCVKIAIYEGQIIVKSLNA